MILFIVISRSRRRIQEVVIHDRSADWCSTSNWCIHTNTSLHLVSLFSVIMCVVLR